MSLNRVLNIGNQGLIAASLGTAVSSHNITNQATEGYSRQRVNNGARPIHHGGGVNVGAPSRVRDQFIDRRLLSAISLDGEATARADSYGVMDTFFEDAIGTVGDSLGGFEQAVADLANDPDSDAARTQLLARAEQLARSFNQANEALGGARQDAEGRIKASFGVINAKLEAIGELGRDIVTARGANEDVSTLMDQRDQLVREVAEYLPVTVLEEESGAISLLLGGSRSLVPVDGPVAKLEPGIDANGSLSVLRTTTGSPEDVTSLVTSGKIGGYLEARDGAIYQAGRDLDALAADVIAAYNTAHSAGVGRDGVSGRDLFEPAGLTSGSAQNMRVASRVAGRPDRIAAASAANLPGDNRNALVMVDVASRNIALSGTRTASEAYGTLVAEAGTEIQAANYKAEHATASLEQVTALRESISGVSSDEEMINLMRYQRAYQASLRVIETADSMLAELLSMRR